MWPPTEADDGEADFAADFAADFPLHRARVAIVGLGLIGGSLALALQGQCAALLGVDPSPEARALAQASGALDAISDDPAALLPAADVVILAAPVRTILALLDALPSWQPSPAIVLDVGSTKTAITTRMAALPPRFDPIGGHPMAGKEHGGFAHAEANLFRDAPFVLTPLPRTTPRARAFALTLVGALQARPLWLDATTHDRHAAAISHLPYLLSLALTLSTPPEAARIAGPGFRSTTRLAASPPHMMADILTTNRRPVLEALRHFRTTLDALETALANDDPRALKALLAEGPPQRHRLLTTPPAGEP